MGDEEKTPVSEPTAPANPAQAEPTPEVEPAQAEGTNPPGKEPQEPKNRRKPSIIITWMIILAVAGFVDFCGAVTSKDGSRELRASNKRVMSYLHNLQPFQASDDFMARLDDNEYGWCVLNWDAPFNVTVARDRINQRFTQQIDQAKQAATSDPSLPDVENRVQQAWADQEQPTSTESSTLSSLFSHEKSALEDNPQDFDDAVDNVLQEKIDALPAYKEQQIWTLGPGFDTLSSLGNTSFYSTRRSFYESQLPTDPDFSRILATFQSAILMAGIHYDDSMKRLNFCRLPAFLRGEDTTPITSPEDDHQNILVMAFIKAPGLLDAYMNTVRLALASNRVQSIIEIIALVVGALILFSIRNNNCFSVVLKLFFAPLAGSLVVGLLWGIAYVITALFGKILAAPAIDVLGTTVTTPFLHWGVGRVVEHHLSEKAIEKYTERKILDK